MDVSSEAFCRHTSARLQAQFLEEPDWTSTRSLANVLDSVVEAAMSGDDFQATLPQADSSSEHQLSKEISALEFQLAQYRERLAQLQAEKASLPHPSSISGLPSLAEAAVTLERIKQTADLALT